jgi:hypothetical protein
MPANSQKVSELANWERELRTVTASARSFISPSGTAGGHALGDAARVALANQGVRSKLEPYVP